MSGEGRAKQHEEDRGEEEERLAPKRRRVAARTATMPCGTAR